MDTEGQNN